MIYPLLLHSSKFLQTSNIYLKATITLPSDSQACKNQGPRAMLTQLSCTYYIFNLQKWCWTESIPFSMSFLILATSSGMYCPRPTANYRTVRIPHIPGQGKRRVLEGQETSRIQQSSPNSPLTREVDFGSPIGGGEREGSEGQRPGPQCRGALPCPRSKAGKRGKNPTITTPPPPPPPKCHPP